MSRARAAVAASIAGLALLLTFSMVSGTAQASPTPGTATTEVSTAATPYAEFTVTSNSVTVRFYTARNAYLGFGRITVYPGGRKHLTVCDYLEEPVGRAGLQIDPSGAQAPIVYRDPNGSTNGCLQHDIGYSVRKWRPVLQNIGTPTWSWPWRVHPLPRPDS